MIKAVIDTNVIVSAYITKNLDAATHFKMWDFFCHQIYAKDEQAPSELTKKIVSSTRMIRVQTYMVS